MKSIGIIGSGTAGLVAALILRQRYNKHNITVVSSKDIGIIGVGEGTTEQWKEFSNFCGLNLVDCITEADATFKYGVMFKGWTQKDYLHYIIPRPHSLTLGQYPFFWGHFISNNFSSQQIHPPNTWNSLINKNDHPNQFHFNTYKLNKFLRKVCESRNIKFVEDKIEAVTIKGGNIKHVQGKQKHIFDFYIDSTGFKKLLINKLGAQWISYKDSLPMNEAIAFQTPDTSHYNAWTLAQAMSAGWLWRIPTWKRWGNGYVYNNKYMDAATAQKECEKVLKQKITVAKNIKFDAGKVDKPWIGNCCAIGLSSNFIEPLEASNIGIAINQAFLLMHYLESDNQFDRDQYNVKCNNIFDNARDFVLLHYLVNKKDSKFWRELKPVIPSHLKKQLAMWKHRLPIKEDFDQTYLLFQALNFTCVLHGIGHFNSKSIKKEFNTINQLAHNMVTVELDNFKKTSKYEGIKHKEYLDYNYFSDAV